ncbi:hypothetical protein SAMN05216412_104146 [Nitrosospira multiformis]|uniref:Uncharacterized protein n=1 Tax=Nitrosospira multiformis TaxID=1231 RepID=A0A1I0CXG9_9PROT|nr:hypothetical protein SAMN05216412_104146 [Nitrosospira multiformis]
MYKRYNEFLVLCPCTKIHNMEAYYTPLLTIVKLFVATNLTLRERDFSPELSNHSKIDFPPASAIN